MNKDFIPKDLIMSLYMDLLKSPNNDIKEMLRDKKLANLLNIKIKYKQEALQLIINYTFK